MTGNEIGAGARAHNAGKRRYWTITAAWTLAIIVLVVAMTQVQQGRGPGSLSPPAGIGFATGLAFAIALGCVGFFRSIDELEARDNFIALTVGFITNMMMVIGWLPLFFADLAGPPNAVTCLIVSSLVTFATYGWLKLRHR